MYETKKDCEKTAEEFCDFHAAKTSVLVAFLANAKIAPMTYNKSFSQVLIGLRLGKKSLRIHVSVDEFLSSETENKLLDKLFSRFGLSSEWKQHRTGSGRWRAHSEMKKELERRGGAAGFSKLEDFLYNLNKSGIPKKKREARRLHGDLARAASALRHARQSGATVRQLNKLIRTVLGEEAVEQVQGS